MRPSKIAILLGALAAFMLALSAVAVAATIQGTSGPDEITGTQGPDQIDGRGGNDEIESLCGNDEVFGGLGNDNVDSGGSAIFGFNCTNQFFEQDDDTAHGGSGRDKVVDLYGPLTGGDPDSDHMTGGLQGDTLNVRDGDGRDEVNGGPGTDTCYGDLGDTFIGCERINP